MLLYLFSMNQLRKIFILFVIVWLIVPRQARGRETYRYELDFIFIPAVDIVMEITDTIYSENQSLALLQFHTKTRPVFNLFFEVDNVYKTIYDPQTFKAYSSEKSIEQPNISQEIKARYSEKTVTYSNGVSRPILPQTNNIFSMLMHLRTLDREQIESENFPVEIEGSLYEVRFSYCEEQIIPFGESVILTDKIEIILFLLTPDMPAITEKTDVFYWKIASSEGQKFIWLEQAEPRRIVKAEFHLGLARLVAKLDSGRNEIFP